MKLPCVVVTWARPLWRNNIAYAQCCEYWTCRLMSNVGSLATWSRFLVDKLIVAQLVKKFAAYYGPRGFAVVFTRTHHFSIIPLHTFPAYFFKSRFVAIRYLQAFLTRGLLVRFGCHTRIVHKLLFCTIHACRTLCPIIVLNVIAEILYGKE